MVTTRTNFETDRLETKTMTTPTTPTFAEIEKTIETDEIIKTHDIRRRGIERQIETLRAELAAIPTAEEVKEIAERWLSEDGATMSDATLVRFLEYAEDTGNWGREGNVTLVGGNVGGDASDKGYLCNMKKRGWITTEVDQDRNDHGEILVWLYLTDEGREVAGIELEDLS